MHIFEKKNKKNKKKHKIQETRVNIQVEQQAYNQRNNSCSSEGGTTEVAHAAISL